MKHMKSIGLANLSQIERQISDASPGGMLSPDWLHAGNSFGYTLSAIGNIDQFRRLSRVDVHRHVAMVRDELGLKHVCAAAVSSTRWRNTNCLHRQRSNNHSTRFGWSSVFTISFILDWNNDNLTCFFAALSGFSGVSH